MAATNLGIPLVGAMSAGFAICFGFMKMVKLDKDNVLTRNIRTIKSSFNEGML
jgi:hypothetical protein